MSSIKINTNKPIKKIRIIKSQNLIKKDTEYPIPIYSEINRTEKDELDDINLNDDNSEDNSSDEDFDFNMEFDSDKDTEDETSCIIKKNIIETPVQQITTFTQYSTITNLDIAIDIDLSKVKEESLPISVVQEEIQKAYNHGFNDGKEVTESTFREEISKHQNWIKNIDLIIEKLRRQFASEYSKLEDLVGIIAVDIAEHIINREVSQDTHLFINQVKKIINELDNELIFKIRVNPLNYDVLQEVKSKLIADHTKLDNIIIAADEEVDLGGCVFETNAGTIDARLKTQLKKMSEELANSNFKSENKDLV